MRVGRGRGWVCRVKTRRTLTPLRIHRIIHIALQIIRIRLGRIMLALLLLLRIRGSVDLRLGLGTMRLSRNVRLRWDMWLRELTLLPPLTLALRKLGRGRELGLLDLELGLGGRRRVLGLSRVLLFILHRRELTRD